MPQVVDVFILFFSSVFIEWRAHARRNASVTYASTSLRLSRGAGALLRNHIKIYGLKKGSVEERFALRYRAPIPRGTWQRARVIPAVAGSADAPCSPTAAFSRRRSGSADDPLLTCVSGDRSSSHVGGLGSHRSRGAVLRTNEEPRLSRSACELQPSQVSAGNTDHSHCHVGISPAPNSCCSD